MRKRLWKTVFFLLVLFVGGIFLLAAITSDAFRIERSISIVVDPQRAYSFLADARNWETRRIANSEIRILDTIPGAKVRYEIRLLEWDSRYDGEFVITPETDRKSRVSWAVSGQRHFFEKAIWILFRMENSIGEDLDTGLSDFKQELERTP